MMIRIDEEYEIYSRQTYTLSNLLQDLGGISTTIIGIGGLVIRLFRDKIFFADVIKQVY